MGQQVVIYYFDTDGDEAFQRRKIVQSPDYDNQFELRMPLSSGIKTDVPLPSGFTIEHLYIEMGSLVSVKVYKNRSPEYWPASRIFQVFDSSVEHLALEATSDVTVYLLIGGS